MEYRNSVTSANGYLYNIVVLGTIDELLGKDMPPFVHENEGTILIYDGHLIDVYGPDDEANSDISWRKSFGYPLFGESTYSYFSWDADEEIHINHNSPFIYYDSTHGEAATSGFVVTKIYTPNVLTFIDDDLETTFSYYPTNNRTRPGTVVVNGEELYFFRSPSDDKTRTVGTTIIPMYAWKTIVGNDPSIYYTESLTPEDGDDAYTFDEDAWSVDDSVSGFIAECLAYGWKDTGDNVRWSDVRNPNEDTILWYFDSETSIWQKGDGYAYNFTWEQSPFEGTAIRRVQSTASTNNVVKGGERFFKGCTSLSEVVMHNATYFGEECFSGCTALQYLYLNQHPCTFDAGCLYNAGVTRGHIWAEGGTTPASWTLNDIPTVLLNKYWIVHNTDDSAFSKGWDVTISDETSITHTINPALTVVSTYNFAQYNQDYTIAYTSSDPEVVVTGVEINGVVKSGASVVHRFTEDSWVQPCTAATVPVTVNFTPGDDWAPGSSVTGSGNYVPGSNCTAAVTVGTGMTFQGWYDFTSATPYEPISTATSYTFVVPEGGCTITAALTHNSLAAITITNPDDAAVYMRHTADDRESSPMYAWTRYNHEETVYTNQLTPAFGDTIYDAEGQSIGGHTVDHYFAHYAFYAWHTASMWPAYRAKDTTHDVTIGDITYRAYQSEGPNYFYVSDNPIYLGALYWCYLYEEGKMVRYVRFKPYVIDVAGDTIYPADAAAYRNKTIIVHNINHGAEVLQEINDLMYPMKLVGIDDALECPYIWEVWADPSDEDDPLYDYEFKLRTNSMEPGASFYTLGGGPLYGYDLLWADPYVYTTTASNATWMMVMNNGAAVNQWTNAVMPYISYSENPPAAGYPYAFGFVPSPFQWCASGMPAPGDTVKNGDSSSVRGEVKNGWATNAPVPNIAVEELKK